MQNRFLKKQDDAGSVPSADTSRVLLLLCDSDWSVTVACFYGCLYAEIFVFDLFLVVGKIKLEFCVLYVSKAKYSTNDEAFFAEQVPEQHSKHCTLLLEDVVYLQVRLQGFKTQGKRTQAPLQKKPETGVPNNPMVAKKHCFGAQKFRHRAWGAAAERGVGAELAVVQSPHIQFNQTASACVHSINQAFANNFTWRKGATTH